MRIVKRFLIIILVVFIGFLAILYWGTYEKGEMAGKIIRISQKGVIFKTYEGKLNLETFGALKGTSPIAESFDFSVERGEKKLIKELEEVALTGERVNLHYKKRFMSFFWRGNSKYFATGIDRVKQQNP